MKLLANALLITAIAAAVGLAVLTPSTRAEWTLLAIAGVAGLISLNRNER